jgi:hypothetical protein
VSPDRKAELALERWRGAMARVVAAREAWERSMAEATQCRTDAIVALRAAGTDVEIGEMELS